MCENEENLRHAPQQTGMVLRFRKAVLQTQTSLKAFRRTVMVQRFCNKPMQLNR